MTYLSAVLEYFDLAQNYRKYQHKLIKNFVKRKILEVGAGNGQIINDYVYDNNNEIFLLEINSDMHDLLKKKFNLNKNVKIINSTIQNLNQQFDTILYLDVIEHIEDHEKEILDAYSKLENDGYLVFIVPAFQNLFSNFDASVGHYRRYEKKFFLEFAKKNKIKCIKAHYFDSIGYFIIIISKLFNFMNFYIHKNKDTVTLGIKFWNLLIPISKILDKILFNSVGKSLICVYQKTK